MWVNCQCKKSFQCWRCVGGPYCFFSLLLCTYEYSKWNQTCFKSKSPLFIRETLHIYNLARAVQGKGKTDDTPQLQLPFCFVCVFVMYVPANGYVHACLHVMSCHVSSRRVVSSHAGLFGHVQALFLELDALLNPFQKDHGFLRRHAEFGGKGRRGNAAVAVAIAIGRRRRRR